MSVTLVRLPEDAARWEQLRGTGVARLALLHANADVPMCVDPCEDWIRLPASDSDIRARARALAVRERWVVASRSLPQPVIDGDGCLRVGEAWVALPTIEAGLMRALIDRNGAVASRTLLADAGWPAGTDVTRNALDTQMTRLRRRIQPLGLSVRTVRSRGYVLNTQET